MTIAPELDGGARPHRPRTLARCAHLARPQQRHHGKEAVAGIAAGASAATHTFNAMRPMDHREPGLLGVVLDHDDLFAEIIADGVHNLTRRRAPLLPCQAAWTGRISHPQTA